MAKGSNWAWNCFELGIWAPGMTLCSSVNGSTLMVTNEPAFSGTVWGYHYQFNSGDAEIIARDTSLAVGIGARFPYGYNVPPD